MRMKKILSALLLTALPVSVHAQTTGWKEGRIVKLWADPSDFVVELESNGPCGSAFFHIQRSATNFEEMSALMMTAAASGRTVNLHVTSCAGDRNIASHGAAYF